MELMAYSLAEKGIKKELVKSGRIIIMEQYSCNACYVFIGNFCAYIVYNEYNGSIYIYISKYE